MTSARAKTFRDALRPDRLLTVSEWADAYRVMDSASSGWPGRWRTARTPYLREPMDVLSPSDPAEFVVMMFASQLGKSEVGLNWLGRMIHHSPGPALLVQPTVETAERFSRQRLAKMIESTPALRELISDPKSRDSSNTLSAKTYPGGILMLTGSNAPAGLASMPARYLMLDEVDRYAMDAGGEGDPVELAIQRTAGFGNRKILITSTPTVAGLSRVEAWYDATDQRHYWVPCPHCGEMQVLEWERLELPESRAQPARYICAHCDAPIANRHKVKMLERGEWRASNPDADARHVGFHLSALYTPHGWPNDFTELARLWRLAQKNPIKKKVFVNTKLARTYDPFDDGDVASEYVAKRTEELGERFGVWADARGEETKDPRVPIDVKVIVAAVDVQDDRLEVEVVGWGAGEERWSLDYRILRGDPSAPRLWERLDDYLARTWRDEDGSTMHVDRALIDSGGHYTQAVYDFTKDKKGRRVMAIKGRAGPNPIWKSQPTKTSKGALLYIVGVDPAKEVVYSRLQVDEPGPGFMHFPMGRQAAYFKALTVERQKKVTRGGQVRIMWVCPEGARNEALDLAVYSYAALKSWLSSGHRLEDVRPRDTVVDRRAKSAQSRRRRAPSRVPGLGGRRDWIGGRKDWLG